MSQSDCPMRYNLEITEHTITLSVFCTNHQNGVNLNGPLEQLSPEMLNTFRNVLCFMALQVQESLHGSILHNGSLTGITPHSSLKLLRELTTPLPLRCSVGIPLLQSNTTETCLILRTIQN